MEDTDEVRQFNKLQEQALEQERFNRRNFRIDEANKTAIIVDGRSSIQLDERGQKLEFKRQSDNQFLSNSAGIVVSGEKGIVDSINFGVMPGEGRPGDGKPGEGKPGNGEKGGGKESRFGKRAQQSFGDQQKELNRQQGLNFDVQRQNRAPNQRPQTAQPANEPGATDMDALRDATTERIVTNQRFQERLKADISTPEFVANDGKWAQADGLSLDIEVPVDGQAISFSKVSGNPKLALSVRPRESVEAGLGMVWTLVWLAVGIGLAGLLSRARAGSAIFHSLPKAMVGVGLVAFFLFVNPAVAWLGFAVFLMGAALLGFQYRRPAV